MDSPTIFAALRDALADIYPKEEDARLVAHDAGLDEKRIAFSPRAQTNWHNILAEAIRVNRLDALWQVIPAEYKANYILADAYKKYRSFIEIGRSFDLPLIQSSRYTRLVPFMAPKPPNPFTQRDYEYKALRRLLLDKTPSITISTALKGAGGFGKTALASKLCWDDDIRTLYRDGILWTTLGESPNITRLQAELYWQLTQNNITFEQPSQGTAALSAVLQGKHCLLVIDDVWKIAHLKYFDIGDKCVRLITSRILDVLIDIPHEQIVEVDQMTHEESLSMLTAGLEIPFHHSQPFADMAVRLGNWALLLEIVNALLRRQTRRYQPLDALNRVKFELDKRGIAEIKNQYTVDERRSSARQTILATFLALDHDDSSQLQSRFYQLGIFPEDTDISADAAARLWCVDINEGLWTIERLDDLSLLKYNVQSQSFRLHDVIREISAAELSNEEQVKLHSQLIRSYEDLIHLPDKYAWNNIVYHLAKAGCNDIVARILTNLEFLHGKFLHVGINSLLNDYAIVQNNNEMTLLKHALYLIKNLINDDPSQFVFQLHSRLIHASKKYALIEELLVRIENLPTPNFIHAMPWLQQSTLFERRVLQSAEKNTYCTAISHDDRWLISGHKSAIRIWDLDLAEEIRVLNGHMGDVNSLALTFDDQLIVSSSTDGTIRIWDFISGETVQIIEQQEKIIAIALTSDDRLIVSASAVGTVCTWDRSQNLHKTILYEGLGSITCFTLTPDKQSIVLGTNDGQIHIRRLTTKFAVTSTVTLDTAIRCVAVHPTQAYVVAGTGQYHLDESNTYTPAVAENCYAYVYDLVSGQKMKQLSFELPITAVTFDKTGKYLLLGCGGEIVGTEFPVFMYDGLSLKCIRTLGGDENWIEHLSLSQDNKHVVVSTAGSKIHIWDVDDDSQWTSPTHDEGICALLVTPDGRFAVSGSEDRTAFFHDLRLIESGVIQQQFIVDLGKDVRRITLLSETKICIHSRSGREKIFSLPEPTMLPMDDSPQVTQEYATNSLKVSFPKSGKLDLHLRVRHERWPTCASISQTGIIIFGDNTGRVYVLKPNTILKKMIQASTDFCMC